MFIHQINPAHANRGADSHQMGTRHHPAFGDGTKIVHLQFDGGVLARSGEVVVQRAADRRVGYAGGDASVHGPGAVKQFGADAALDGNTVAMGAEQFEAQQVIEGVPGEKAPGELEGSFRVAQVW